MTDEFDYFHTTPQPEEEPAAAPDPAPFTDEGFTAQETAAKTEDVFSGTIPTDEDAAQPEAAYTAPQQADDEVQSAQPEPETVHAEPAPEYASADNAYSTYSQGIPPYGQRTAGSAYSQQPPYGARNTYGTQPPYGAQNANSGTQPPYGTQNTYGSTQPPYGTRPHYGTQTAYGAQPPYGTPPYTQTPRSDTPAKKSKKGLQVFFRILVAVIILSLVFAVVRLAMDRPGASQTDNGTTGVTAAADAPEMETKASPASDSKAVAGQVLTPTQIAAKVRASSVGILVYSGRSTGTAGQGSGVLWKEDNSGTYTYIITCAHVVNGSGYTYSVQTEDSKTYDAELVGADAKADLAVLRIKATGLSLAEFGDSSALQVGDPVYAIGNPGGTEFFGSFTSGIVSAIDRSVKNTYTMVCIQHTAAINPGNSGGALVNQYGQVIGINSQKISSTEYEGMGFAIPIKPAQKIINALASYGYVKDRPKLGITYAEALNYQQYSMIIKLRNLPSGSLVISSIDSDSSLASADVKSGDMIIKVDGKDMTTPNVLLDKIENGKVGDKLTLTIYRVDNNYNPTEFTVTATLVEEKPQSQQQEETTTQQYINPYDFFNGDFGSFFGRGN